MKTLCKLLNSKVSLLIIGFILTGVVGHYLSYTSQRLQWRRQTALELTNRRLNEAQSIIDEITLHMRTRFYAMQKVYWRLESGDVPSAQVAWTEYESIKDDWNTKVYLYRINVRKFFGDDLAYQILSESNSRDYRSEDTVHSCFVRTHNALKTFLRNPTSKGGAETAETQALAALSGTSKEIDRLTEQLIDAYLTEYSNMQGLFCEDRKPLIISRTASNPSVNLDQ